MVEKGRTFRDLRVVMTRKSISFRREHTNCDCRYSSLNKIPADQLATLRALAQADWDAKKAKRLKRNTEEDESD